MNSVIRHDLYGLTSTPFFKDPQKPFLDDQHRQCLDGLEKFLQFRGFAAVPGRPGAGKTIHGRLPLPGDPQPSVPVHS